MNTTHLMFEDVSESRRQEIVGLIRKNFQSPIEWVWSKNKRDDKFTRDVIGVIIDSEDAVLFKLKFGI